VTKVKRIVLQSSTSSKAGVKSLNQPNSCMPAKHATDLCQSNNRFIFTAHFS